MSCDVSDGSCSVFVPLDPPLSSPPVQSFLYTNSCLTQDFTPSSCSQTHSTSDFYWCWKYLFEVYVRLQTRSERKKERDQQIFCCSFWRITAQDESSCWWSSGSSSSPSSRTTPLQQHHECYHHPRDKSRWGLLYDSRCTRTPPGGVWHSYGYRSPGLCRRWRTSVRREFPGHLLQKHKKTTSVWSQHYC